ncbi:TonB-dependent SusC/RagA subfamily outer membrane receptor [Flavobacterium sp. 9]|uniref:alpha-2-macroglobulin family protein n=1 Tax=Flavobacterium sp. 9 TaxID=2035198 RepID=UPI000C1969A0|nr:MG2 domain-containing protein [Flavobacterium sp. 9]PIF31469.1 TonB-dependent SusC/RagA subfamily outer membrane receptor [Flavobacterium sp. 9]
MKNILFVFLLFTTALFAQKNDKNWAKVASYENEGKIKSANEIVDKIYKKAVSRKDEVQMIKCFFYQSKYLQVVDENAKTKILDHLKTDISRVSIPSKAILNLVYAKCLDNYSNYDYAVAVVDSAVAVVDEASVLIDSAAATIDTSRIDGIAIPKSNDTDIDFTSEKEIIALYEKTLENESILKKTSLTKYKAIFSFLTLERLKNENLYDYLLKENIAFFTEKIEQWEIESSQIPAYKKELLGNSESFLELDVNFMTEENFKKVLSLYQKLESDNPSLENQFDRIIFCSEFMPEPNEDFITFLNEFQKRTDNPILIQKILLKKAEILHNLASKELHPDYNIQAVKIYDDVVKINNQTSSAQTALEQKQIVTLKSLNARLQKFIYNKENTRAFITYKNLDHLRISFYTVDQKKFRKFLDSYDNIGLDSLVDVITKKQIKIASKDYQLQNKKDYFEYTTEVLLPTLETGTYLIYFESDSDSKEEKAYSYEIITVSNLSILASQETNKENFQVLDRKTGKPLENAIIKSKLYTLKTDSKGLASYIGPNNDDYDEQLEVSLANDTILSEKNYLARVQQYNQTENNTSTGKVEFYLDRAIYRPGQTVYYKGIAIKKQKNKNTIVANTTFKLFVRDANRQTFKELEVVTNEFGSFSGEFTLPKNSLTGDFNIYATQPDNYEKGDVAFKSKPNASFWKTVNLENSSTYFRVEEYKRPKFKADFDPKKESFQVNQSIKVSGTAKAFAGSNISDAKVTYKVNRFTRYVSRNYSDYWGLEQNEIIATGETKTDASGKFIIEFIAEPSKNAIKEQLPVFSYSITADVTDINGETHTAETTVKVGYHDLIINASIPSSIETKKKNEITLTSTNLNGEFLAAKGEIKLYFVSPFSNKFKENVWQKPEIESISASDFERLFPYEIIESKTDKANEILLFSKKVDTEKDKEIALDFISDYKSGNYKIVFSAKDTFNNLIESSSNFEIKQSKDKFNPGKLFTAEQINTDPKKDGFVVIKLSSVIPDLYINTNGNYGYQTYFENIYHLQNNEITIKVPLKKEFENSVCISFQSIFDNEIFNDQIYADLKTQESKLELLVESFRSKIEPGSKENWSFKLKSINSKTEAEVLASMYDSSLDQFIKKDWKNDLSINNYHYNSTNFKSGVGFERIYSSLKNLNEFLPLTEFKNDKTQLNWFGFDFDNSRYGDSLGITTVDIKDRKVGAETIKGDPDAVLTVDEPVGAAPVSVIIEEDSVGAFKTKKALIYNSRSEKSSFKIKGSVTISPDSLYIIDGQIASEKEANNINPADILSMDVLKGEKATALYGSKGANGVIIITTKKSLEELTKVKARKNLSETAFFLPNLKTDSTGKVSFNFTSPEALTAWKLRLLAHNKDAVSGYLEKSVVTQKELMVLPNFPRFFREKDTIVISAKISNITDKAKTGIAILQFFDATTMQPIDAKMLNAKNVRNFTVGAFGNTTATWTVSIPEGLQGVQYKILAKSGDFSDGEENILPVLTNNMLVTESMPIWVRENSTKEYTFENLKNNTSTTLKNHQFTLEYTSNPAWIAIQSLPYLMEYEHECAEQTFARFYANALASEIISSNPKIATVFENWRKNGKLNSKLEENEELKSIILAETPWLNDAQSEDEKKKSLALLFDLEKMKTSQEATFDKLKQKQKPSGAFSWFDGSDESEYITRHILAGLGHLSKLDKSENNAIKINQIAEKGVPFLDNKFLEYYKSRTKNLKKSEKLIWFNPYSDLHYLYTRSFYLDKYPLSDTLKKATRLYLETAKKDWLNYSLYEKGLAALTLNRFGEKDTAKKIIESLKETASNNEDWGMYWIANKAGWYWYQAPIETQALLIEAFAEVNNDTKSVDAMKVWLLKNKQTKNWPTTKSTTEAVYALLMQGNDWLSVKDNTVIKIGSEKILTKKLAENEKEAETGYIKLNWKTDEVKKDMASISIQNKSKVPGFGGVYWQYFEDLDKIKNNSGTVLSVSKELYLKKSSLKGDQLQRITTKNPLKTGDLITVRLVIKSKEDMEYVHLKDMRASCFEPVNVLSEYKYKDRLGYYMSTKDAATHLFFDHIDKGTYVIEYDIRVNNNGEFSNGITTIESMYAPEFSSHTKGIRVKVK